VRPEEESATKAAADDLYQTLIGDPARANAACMNAESLAGHLERFPLVAAVRKVRVVKDITPCPDDFRASDPNTEIFCAHLMSVRFAELSFVKRPNDAEPRDSFRIEFSYEYGEPEKKEGIHLEAAQRYLIFAKPGADNAVPRTDWEILTACPF
jgi:hypothetical protein